MAVVGGTIEAILRLRDQFSPGLAKAVKNAQTAGQQIAANSKQIRNTGAKLTAGITLPMLGAATAALKFSTDLNESMANVATLIPGNVARVEELKVAVQDMAIATGKSTTDVSEGLYQVISAFGDGADTASILKTNVEAAAAGMATTTDAIALTSAVTKAYGTITAEGVRQAADLAFTTVKLGQTSFPELAGAIGKVAVSASGLGITQQELNAVFATMTGVTGKAAEVSTQFRGALVGLKKPSDLMSEALGKIGFETGEAAIASLGFQGTLTALAGTTGGNVGQMAKLFESTESWDFIAGIAGVQAEKFTSNLDAMEGSTGTLSEALNEQQNGINAAGFAWEQLKQKFVVTAQRIGDQLAPSFQDLLEVVNEKVVPAVQKLVDWFVKLTPAEQKAKLMTAAIVALSPVLILMIGQLGLAATAVANLATFMKLGTAATWLYQKAKVALKFVLSGMKAVFIKFVSMLGVTKLAEIAATITTASLTTAFLALWTATGVGAVIIAGIAAAFALFKFAKWIAQTRAFTNAWIKLKGWLGLLTEEQVDAALAANALGDSIEDVGITADEARKALSDRGLTGTMEDLQDAMVDLSGVAGALSEDEMRSIAERAIELRDAGQQLTPELERIVYWFDEQQEAAREAAKKLAEETAAAEEMRLEALRVAEALAEQEEAQQDLIDKTEDLRAELAGDALTGELAMLQAAWEDLTPEQQANQEVMERVAKRAEALADEMGPDALEGDLRAVVDAMEDTTEATKDAGFEMSETEKAAEKLARRISGADLRGAVEAIDLAMFNLASTSGLTDQAILDLGEEYANAEGKGALLNETQRKMAQHFRDTKLAAEEVVGPMQGIGAEVDALVAKWGDTGLNGEIGAAEVAFRNLEPHMLENAKTMQRVGDDALALRDRGAELSDELNTLADKAEKAKGKLGGMGDEIDKQFDAFNGLHQSLVDLSQVMGGAGAGFIGGLGKMVGGMKVAGQSMISMHAGMEGIRAGGLSAVAGMANMATGMIGLATTAIQAGKLIVGAFKKIFGRSTEENMRITATRMWGIAITDTAAKAAADMSTQVGDDFAALLLTLGTVIETSGGVMALGFTNVTKAARDTFSAIDMGKLDTEQALEGLTPVLKALAVEFDNAGADGQAQFLELITLAQKFGLDMDAIVQIVGEDLVNKALGQDLPTVVAGMRDGLIDLRQEGLQPFMQKLIDLGAITEDQRLAMNELMHGSQVDFKAMEAAASKYGIELSALGPKFDEAKLNDIANNIIADFEMLTQNGADVVGVITGMGDEVNDLVADAQSAGVAIPDNMRPIIEQMIEMGTLVGANGEAITDMSDVNFAEPMAEKFDKVVDKLGIMIDKFLELLGLSDDVATSVNNIPEAKTINVGFHVDDLGEIAMPDVDWDWGSVDMNWDDLNIPSFSHGTGGAFHDFGTGTPVILHGRERVQTQAEVGTGETDFGVLEQKLSNIENLLRRQPRALGVAISDSLTLIN